MEHTPLNGQIENNIMVGVKGADVVLLVRVAWNKLTMIKRALDIRASGVEGSLGEQPEGEIIEEAMPPRIKECRNLH